MCEFTFHILSQRYAIPNSLEALMSFWLNHLSPATSRWNMMNLLSKKNMSIFHPVFLEYSFFAARYPLEKIEASCSILETKIGFSRIRRCRNNWTFPSWSPREPCRRFVPVFQGCMGWKVSVEFVGIYIYVYIYIYTYSL